MIRIGGASSILDIENALTKLKSSTGDEKLQIPSNMRFGGAFGIPTALIQFVVAWSRLQNIPTLQLHTEQLESLSGTPHGMVALYCSQETIQPETHTSLTPKESLKHVAERVRAMQEKRYLDTTGTRGVVLCCFAGARNEFISPFYPYEDGERLRSRSEFKSLTKDMLSKFAPEALHRLGEADIENLGFLIFELFSNTHEHARFGLNKNILKPSARGVLMTYIPDVYKKIKGDAGDFIDGDPSLGIYLNRELVRQPTIKINQETNKLSKAYLELSIFDTGLGLARHWLAMKGRDADTGAMSYEEEFEVVKNCFEEHVSTKDVLGSGHGLPSVLESLRHLRAYLRLRTGRLCLVQDFGEKQYSGFALKPWRADKKVLENTEGAVYSIIVPLAGSK
ncbi:MAG: hypothetical protein ABL902_02820 [Gallionella sp.]